MQTKTANKKAIKVLPALRASLLWYKREIVRGLRNRAERATSVRMREALEDKARKVAKTDLADLRASYINDRVSDIRHAPLSELAAVIPNLVRL